MEELIRISLLNDFIFCPVSIYFHKLYGNLEKSLYQEEYQIKGTQAHNSIDKKTYSTKTTVLQGIDVYSSKYNILGKIDIYDVERGLLTERKNKITQIYDGYVIQLYAEYFALVEMGYDVKKIRFYSMSDNKVYNVLLPKENPEMFEKFEHLILEINNFDIQNFRQQNSKKCMKCIYEPVCDRSMIC